MVLHKLSQQDVFIEFIGKGGHASQPELSNDPCQHAVEFHIKLRELIQLYKDKGVQFSCCMPFLHVGQARNVIAEKAVVQGTLRTFDPKFADEFRSKLKVVAEEASKSFKGDVKIEIESFYPQVVNWKKQTDHVRRVAAKIYGESNIIEEGLPAYFAEDFSFFLQKTPGCMFYPTSWKEGITSLHSNHYNFNDDCLGQWTELIFRLIEDRFDANFGESKHLVPRL